MSIQPSDNWTLKLLSYNIHKGLNSSNRQFVLHKIREALTTVDADILLLQEIVDSHSRFKQRFPDHVQISQFDYLSEIDWQHFAFGRNAIHRHGSHGNAILSRYPIHQWCNIDATINRFEQRGILHTQLKIPQINDELHICCVHLNLFSRDREHQLDILIQHLNEHIPEHAPLIIAGDFNDWPQKASKKLFNHINLKEAHYSMHGSHAHTYPSWRPLLKLDRIYYRNLNVTSASALKGDPWHRLSDHLPIVASFQLPPNQTPMLAT